MSWAWAETAAVCSFASYHKHLFIYRICRLLGGWRKTARAHGLESLSRYFDEQTELNFLLRMAPTRVAKKLFIFFDRLAKV